MSESIDATCASLAELDRLKEHVNNAALTRVPSLVPRLRPIEARLAEQANEVAALQARTHALLAKYNDIMGLVSLKFIDLDDVLRKAGV